MVQRGFKNDNVIFNTEIPWILVYHIHSIWDVYYILLQHHLGGILNSLIREWCSRNICRGGVMSENTIHDPVLGMVVFLLIAEAVVIGALLYKQWTGCGCL